MRSRNDTAWAFDLVSRSTWMVLPAFLTASWSGAVDWAWGAASIYIISQAGVFFTRFRGGKWKQMRVIEGV